MAIDLSEPHIHRILNLPNATPDWERELERLRQGDLTLSRKSAGESAIMAVQRLLVFLGYSTSSSGAFAIDGDFGRGTNRAVAQFQFESGLSRKITREVLCYDCTWQNAQQRITQIPDTRLTFATLETMVQRALEAVEQRQVLCGDFEEAVRHLDALHRRQMMTCREILDHYGDLAGQAGRRLDQERGVTVQPEWMLAIIRQETSGVVRPRFEQHLLTRYNRQEPTTDFVELRYRAMSMGLGQILGVNFQKVGAASAQTLYTSPLAEQVLFVARFIAAKPEVVSKKRPTDQDFRTLARYYNGSGYEAHHYHEGIARWFREFSDMM